MEKPPYFNTKEEVLSNLNSRKDGLTTGEARTIRAQVGLNKIPKKRVSFYQKYFKPVINLMIVVLIFTAILQIAFVYFFNEGTYTGPIIVLIILSINILIGFRQQFQAEKTLEALERLTSFKAYVLRDGLTTEIDASDIFPDDVLTLKQGDYISADARVIESNNLTIDESVLTGESVAVEKTDSVMEKKFDKLPLQEQKNMIFNSTFVVAGNGRAVITATEIKTEIGKISEGIALKNHRDIPLSKSMNKLAKGLSFSVLLIIIVLFTIQYIDIKYFNADKDLISELSWLISLAVAAIPFNFPLITTIVLLTGVLKLSREQAIVRNLNAVETMGRLDYICSDKTGTLTKNQMTVQKIFYNNKIYDVTGLGYENNGEILLNNKKVSVIKDLYLWNLIISGVVNNNAEFKEEEIQLKKGKTKYIKVLGMATEGSLLTLAQKAQIDYHFERNNYKTIKELSFNSKRKKMSKIVERDKNIQCLTKGAPDVLLPLSSQIAIDGKIVEFNDELKENVQKNIENFAKKGLRTLALTFRPLDIETKIKNLQPEDIEKNLIFLGVVGLLDPPRLGVAGAIAKSKKAGIKVVMITGDHPTTAKSIASTLNIYKEGGSVITGHDIEQASVEDIENCSVFARVAPNDKNFIMETLQSKNHIVAMTGDGVNDALALENADVGIAMGMEGTDVAKNAADIILTDDSFVTIENAIFHGRGLFNNIRSNIVFLLVVNLMELILLTTITLVFDQKIFTSLQLIILYAIPHFFPPLGLMFDKYDPILMKEPPKKSNEPLISKPYKKMMALQMLVIAGVLIFIWILITSGTYPTNEINRIEVSFRNPISNRYVTEYILGPGETITFSGEEFDNEILKFFKARTICFITIVFSEIWVALEARSIKKSIFKGNRNLALSLFVIFVLGIIIFMVMFDFSQIYFNFIPLSMIDWMIAIGASLPVIILTEIWKKI